MSGEVVLMTLLGGMGTIFGPVAARFVIAAMESYLSDLGAWVTIAQGIIFVVCVLAFRRGIVGELEAWLRKRESPRAHKSRRERSEGLFRPWGLQA
jgi:branched-chain amino acid transport system permease protein